MKVIVGIGNPGNNYLNTRHNIGFQVLDKFCEKHNLKFRPGKSNFWLVESKLDAFHFFLIKPVTYVNNSGIAVKEILESIEMDINNLLVVYDDTNLEPGILRIRKSGNDGGHNGIKSIIYHLEENKFARLRIGIGKPDKDQNLADYVLSNITEDEYLLFNKNIPFIIDLIEKFIIGGSDGMLNFYSEKTKVNSTTNSQLNRK